MIKIYNNIIPFGTFKAITLGCFVFIRKGCIWNEEDDNHEKIHVRQQNEMLWVFFWLWYCIEWVFRLFTSNHPYRNISFEREAYANDYNMSYLKERKFWSWTKYL